MWIFGPEREGDSFGLKIDNARNNLLIASDLWSKLWPAAMTGQISLSVLASPALSPCSSGRNFPYWPFKRSCLRLSAQAAKVKGEGHTSWQPRMKGSSGNTWSAGCFSGDPLKIVDLNVWIRNDGYSCKGNCYSPLIELVWFEGPLFTPPQRI